jgi:hypothetical protein
MTALPQALSRNAPDYHAREAAHLRTLAEVATTSTIKRRLLHEAEEHEGLAKSLKACNANPRPGEPSGGQRT